MERMIKAGRLFFRTLGNCISRTWKETDSHYHIPKSRFADSVNSSAGQEGAAGPGGACRVADFVGCFRVAWKAADDYYHIPKTRFRRAEVEGLVQAAPAGSGGSGPAPMRPYFVVPEQAGGLEGQAGKRDEASGMNVPPEVPFRDKPTTSV